MQTMQRSNRAKFEKFHREHPEVYDELRRMAYQLLRAGHKRYSVDAMLHVVRWHRAMAGKDADGFKMNNNYAAFYARMLSQEPELSEMFEMRKATADSEAEGEAAPVSRARS